MTVPSNINVPGSYVSISNVRAITGLTGVTMKTVFYGQMLSSGSATALQMIKVSSEANAQELFGIGSQLALMFRKYFKNNQLNEVYAVPMEDDGSATAAEFLIELGGPATAAGTMALYIDGDRVQAGVTSGMTAEEIASALTAAVNADVGLGFTASTSGVTAGQFKIIAKNAGTVANQSDIRFNYATDDSFPTGVSLVSNTLTAGATDPDLDTAIAATPDKIYSLFCHPYQDTTNIGKLRTELTRRWGPLVQLEGHAIIAKSGSFSAVSTFGETFNDPHMTVWDGGSSRPCADYLQAAAVTGVAAYSLGDDPGRPLQTLSLVDVLRENESAERLLNERNQLVDSGVSISHIDNGGNIVIDRLVTTYLTNTSGARDKSYQNIQTMFISSYVRQTLLAKISQTYPRHKLGADGGKYGSNQPVATPKQIRGTILSWFKLLEKAALVENYDQFNEELSVVRDIDDGGSDPDRVNAVLPTDYINQFRIFAGEVQFIL